MKEAPQIEMINSNEDFQEEEIIKQSKYELR